MRKKKDTDSSDLLVKAIVEGMQENKAKDIVILDLRKLSTHVDGIANSIARFTRKELKEKPWHIEGKTNSEWILLDYINVVSHVFYKDARNFYELEDLWADGIRTDIPNIN